MAGHSPSRSCSRGATRRGPAELFGRSRALTLGVGGARPARAASLSSGERGTQAPAETPT